METLRIERSSEGGAVATVTLDRPEKKNAINEQMWAELSATATELSRDPSVRCVVLTGAGGAFCSGQDLSARSSDGSHSLERMRRLNEVVGAWHDIPKPTIAKVVGIAAGVGLNIALGCDLVVAAQDARFSEIFARRGLSVDGGGSWLLPRLVGIHRAKELALLADIISATEAESLGLVNRVVANDAIDAFVTDWATRLAEGPPIALASTKQMLNRAFELTFEQALEAEAVSQSVNLSTADTAEAMTAFLEKREPRFHGR